MTDLGERFRLLDRIEFPLNEPTFRASRSPREPDEPPRQRIGAVALALVLSLAATILVVIAFGDHRSGEPTTSSTSSPSSAPPGAPPLMGTARIKATIALPGEAISGGVAVGAGSTWVGFDGHDGSGVMRIDPETNEIVATIPLQVGPGRKRIAATDGAVWVASTGSLQRIDPATNSVVANVEIPGRSISAITADETDVWAVTIGSSGGILVRVDQGTDAISAEIPLGPQIMGYEDEVQIGAGSVWVLGVTWIERENAEYGSDLIRVDPATNTVSARIPVGGFHMVVGTQAVWVSSIADGVFDEYGEPRVWTKVDMGTNLASDPFRFGGDGLRLVTPDALWAVDYDDQQNVRVSRFDPQTLSLESKSEPVRSSFTDAVIDPISATVWISALHEVVRLDIS